MWRLIGVIIIGCLATTQAQANNDTNTSDGDDTQCPINIPGFFHRGNCNLFCQPATWNDVLIFFLGNYVAHAASVITLPGQSTFGTIIVMVTAILFPSSGVRNGLRAIRSLSQVRSFSNLQKAARAGALLTVVEMSEEERKEGARRIPRRAIHGSYNIPDGYKLTEVAWDATFEKFDEEAPPSAMDQQNDISNATKRDPLPKEICCSYNWIQIIASLVQLIFASVTLYRTRGNQIERYGYAAFGLTVVPYAWMSLINLLGNLMSPQYDTTFIVGSATLQKARKKQGKSIQNGSNKWSVVECTVGILSEPENKRPSSSDSTEQPAGNQSTLLWKLILRLRGLLRLLWKPFLLPFKMERLFGDFNHYRGAITNNFEDDLMYMWMVSLVPIAIVGGLSHFRPRESATYQRVWTMLWLVCGQTVGTNTAALYDLHAIDSNEFDKAKKPDEAKQPEEEEKPGGVGKHGEAKQPEEADKPEKAEEAEKVVETKELEDPKKSERTDSFSRSDSRIISKFRALSTRMFWAAVPIGGLVVVGQMIREFGTCVEL